MEILAIIVFMSISILLFNYLRNTWSKSKKNKNKEDAKVAAKNKKSFAFVANIIEDKDVRLKAFFPILGWVIPLFIWRILFYLKARWGKGFSLVATYDVFGEVTGYTVLVELTAKQIVRHRGLAREVILRACLFAQNTLKVNYIGLGSLSKFVTDEGAWLKTKNIHIPVTHGDTYTTASAFNGILMMQEEFSIKDPIIAVVGAYGKIGRALCLLLDKMGYSVVAMGRNFELLEQLKKECPNIRTTQLLADALANSQLAVMATSATYSVVDSESLLPNRRYYLYDIGQPYNLFPKQYEALKKEGHKIIRIDGGFEGPEVPIDIGFWMRLHEGTLYACYTEVVLQALEGDETDHIGPIDLSFIDEVRARAKKWRFHHLPLTCYNIPIQQFLDPEI